MKPLLASGQVKPLAVSTTARVAALPNVTTGAESGFPTFNLVGWTGIAGPPGLPAAVVERWDAAIQGLSRDSEFRAALAALSAEPAYLGPAAFKAALKTEYEEALSAAGKLGVRKELSDPLPPSGRRGGERSERLSGVPGARHPTPPLTTALAPSPSPQA